MTFSPYKKVRCFWARCVCLCLVPGLAPVPVPVPAPVRVRARAFPPYHQVVYIYPAWSYQAECRTHPPNRPQPFEERILKWEAQLNLVSEILDQWIAVQRNWM
jgi:hypothetical protein